MKYFYLVQVCLICVANSYAQTRTRSYHTVDIEITKEKKPKKIYAKIITISEGSAVDSSLIQSIEESINRSISLKNKVKAGKYIVSVKFLLERDGSIADARCIKDPGFEMCEQVMSAFRKKGPP